MTKSCRCSFKSCQMYLCPNCNQWHPLGQCPEKPKLPPGMRECPFCHKIVEKIDACNHISCCCGKHFCYHCGAGFNSGDETYSHMGREGHCEEAPDYLKYIKNQNVSDETLNQFYQKYPKYRPN